MLNLAVMSSIKSLPQDERDTVNLGSQGLHLKGVWWIFLLACLSCNG